MKIYIEDLTFQCIIGILDFEREQEQDVIINVEIEYDFNGAFINYADVAQLLRDSMKKEKFLLIEDALEALSINLKKNFSHIETLYIKITKPSILPTCRVSVSNLYTFDS